jgi:hypothetical protein
MGRVIAIRTTWSHSGCFRSSAITSAIKSAWVFLSLAGTPSSAKRGRVLRDKIIWHIEDALSSTIGDRLVEKPEFIPFPSKSAPPKITTFEVIVCRCGIPKNRVCWLTIDHVHHADQGTGRKVHGPTTAELIVEDQPKRIDRSKIFLEALCGMNEKPTSMAASPMPGFMHLTRGTSQARPRLPKRDRLHHTFPTPSG